MERKVRLFKGGPNIYELNISDSKNIVGIRLDLGNLEVSLSYEPIDRSSQRVSYKINLNSTGSFTLEASEPVLEGVLEKRLNESQTSLQVSTRKKSIEEFISRLKSQRRPYLNIITKLAEKQGGRIRYADVKSLTKEKIEEMSESDELSIRGAKVWIFRTLNDLESYGIAEEKYESGGRTYIIEVEKLKSL